MKAILLLTILTFFLACLTPANAEIVIASSIEWLSDTSESIGTYNISDIFVKEFDVYNCLVSISESIKGNPPNKTIIIYYSVSNEQSKKNVPVKINDEILIFFRKDEKEVKRAIHQINLNKPRKRGYDCVAITSQFELLTEKIEIIKIVEDRLNNYPGQKEFKYGEWPEPVDRFEIEIPYNSPAFEAIWGGSSCFLLVPEDLKHKSKQKAEELKK